MQRRLKKVKNYLATGWYCWKPYYKKRWFRKEKKSTLGFPFEYELDEIVEAVNDIRRWDKDVKHIIVDDVFDVFFPDDKTMITL